MEQQSIHINIKKFYGKRKMLSSYKIKITKIYSQQILLFSGNSKFSGGELLWGELTANQFATVEVIQWSATGTTIATMIILFYLFYLLLRKNLCKVIFVTVIKFRNRTISDAIQLTSSGGGLYDAQQRANTGLDDFRKLMEINK